MNTEFQKSVWNTLRKIPKGKVTTYKAIAKYVKKPNAFRAVGTAVGKNLNAPQVPCHRVVNADGKIGNYSGKGGVKGKIQLLQSEGMQIENGKIKNFPENFFDF